VMRASTTVDASPFSLVASPRRYATPGPGCDVVDLTWCNQGTALAIISTTAECSEWGVDGAVHPSDVVTKLSVR